MLTWVQGDLITYISVGNVNWKSQSGKQQLFKKLIMHHHTTIAFLGIYPREMKTNGDTKSLYSCPHLLFHLGFPPQKDWRIET